MTGGVLSIRTVSVLVLFWFPASSVANYVRVVAPSAEIVTEAAFPATVCNPAFRPPLRANWICLTAEPPGLSVAFRLVVTFVLFQP